MRSVSFDADTNKEESPEKLLARERKMSEEIEYETNQLF
jgi:hypothetical protein